MGDVRLAGHNIDSYFINVLKELANSETSQQRNEEIIRELSKFGEAITPETISAASARISRSTKVIKQLRKDARKDVQGARESNKNIVFGLGHASVAEHAIFNLDVSSISRLGIEKLEGHRLPSYTEGSQRYTKADSYMVPIELEKSPDLKSSFIGHAEDSFKLYKKLLPILKKYFLAEGKKERDAESLANEDARYALLLATTTQVAMTANARSLEYLIQRSSSSPLQEIREELSSKLLEILLPLAPSLIKYTEPNPYHGSFNEFDFDILNKVNANKDPVRLIKCPKDMDNEIIAAILFKRGKATDYGEALKISGRMSTKKKEYLIKDTLKNLKVHDAVPRSFELSELIYQLEMSASAYAQFKRHRIATQEIQPYNISLGITPPPSFEKVKVSPFDLMKTLEIHSKKSNELYQRIVEETENPYVAQYALTNAHKRSVLFKANAREIYHISRLREDEYAQWDIRKIANQMLIKAREMAPLTFMLAGGKHEFDKTRREIYK